MLIQNQFRFVMNPSRRAARLDDAKPEVNARHVKPACGGGLVSGSLRFTRGAIVGMNESEESFPDGPGQIRIETESGRFRRTIRWRQSASLARCCRYGRSAERAPNG